MLKTTTTPPGGTPLEQAFTYDPDGKVLTVKINGTLIADPGWAKRLSWVNRLDLTGHRQTCGIGAGDCGGGTVVYGSMLTTVTSCQQRRGGELCKTESVASRRATRNKIPTLIGLAIAKATGASSFTSRADGVIIASGAAGYGGTTTFGNVVVTNESSLDVQTTAHEMRHVSQWAAMGNTLIPLTWAGGEYLSYVAALTGNTPSQCRASRGCINPIELGADPYLGGYWRRNS